MSSYKKGGWDDKYIITKKSGKPVSKRAKYFVPRFDKDPHARKALKFYADSVYSDNFTLACDIDKKLAATAKPDNGQIIEGCKNCNYFRSIGAECCRYPKHRPIPVDNAWCGEYKSKVNIKGE